VGRFAAQLDGGRWTDRDASGNVVREVIETRKVPKYLPVERWHIERWMPAESYGSPEQWYAQTTEVEDGIRIAVLGPYPARGEYEHCFTLKDVKGEFMPLSPAACDWIVRAVQWAKQQPRREQGGAIAARESRRGRYSRRRCAGVSRCAVCGRRRMSSRASYWAPEFAN
jgi:hypothetical protein